jgi:benzoate membrane transport protein
LLETGPGFRSSIKDLPDSLSLAAVTYGVTAWLFAVTGPFLIYVNAARQGNLSALELNAWIFGGYFGCGLLSVALTLYYRMPLLAAITIPGGVLVAGALAHLTFPQVIGAYVVTGILITLLGLTGLVKKIMSWLPMPIAMAMVAGVLLQFGLGIVTSLEEAPLICGITLSAFLCVSLVKPLARRFPPVLGAILGGFAATGLLTETEWHRLDLHIAEITVFTPDFTWPATMELVVPLIVTVVAIQNAQGMTILRAMGYEPPFNAVTIVSGVGSVIVAPFGSQSVCLAGPMTGIVTNPSVGAISQRYSAAIVTGILWMLFGLFSPVATALSRILPGPLIDLLAGLALLEVLASCFAAAFGGTFRFGAILTFLITISGVRLLNVGAPFWGLMGGAVFSLLLDRADFTSRTESRQRRTKRLARERAK